MRISVPLFTPGFDKTEIKVLEGDGRNVTLEESLCFTRRSGETILLPAGTMSDGASTPQIIWNLIPPFGPHWKACLVHDFAYRKTTKEKAECDLILLEAMEIDGVSMATRKLIYWGVKYFGKKSFDDDRKVMNG